MNLIDEYFNSVKDKLIIDSEVYEILKEKIDKENLRNKALQNLNKILNASSEFKSIEISIWLRNFIDDYNIQAIENGERIEIKRVPIKKIEPNSLRINTKSCGVIQFRVPSNTVKSALRAKEEAAQFYVVTDQTFYNGANYISVTFPIFHNFFNCNFKRTYFLCVNERISEAVRTLIKEEIFGPTLLELKESGLTEKEAEEFYNELKTFVFKIKENNSFREAVLNDYAEILKFKNNYIKIRDVEIKRINDLELYEIKENGEKLGFVDLRNWEDITINEEFGLKEPGKDAEFGVYFFDPSTGFDPERLTSSFIVWIGNGKGMVVDPLTNLPQYLDKKRIRRNDIEYIFLSHIHSDHDDGVLEQLLSGKKIKILTTKLIFDSFVRKVSAITGWNKEKILSLLSFEELKINEPFKLNDKCSIVVNYAFHSIPTCRFVITYNDVQKNITKSISYSGDTNFNRAYVEKLLNEGKITKKRADAILGFIWDSDLIIHDTGGGIHTSLDELLKLPIEIQNKIIAIHIHSLPENSQIMQAQKGEEVILVKSDKIEQFKRMVRKLDETILLKNLTTEEKFEFIENSQIERFKKDELILKSGNSGKKFYIIESGEVEVETNEGKKIYLGKGDYFGEMALLSEEKGRNANVYAKTDVELLSITEEKFLKFKDKIIEIYENILKNKPLLLKIPFFKVLSESEVNALASIFIEEKYKKGDYIIRYGEIGDKFYIVKFGVLNVIGRDENGNPKVINKLGVANTFGEIALIEKVKRTADVVVNSDYAIVIYIDSESFNNIIKLYPGISVGIDEIKNLYKRKR